MENMVQVKYIRLSGGEMRKAQLIDFGRFESPMFQNLFEGGLSTIEPSSSRSLIINQSELKDTWKKLKQDWFGDKNTFRSFALIGGAGAVSIASGGVFWDIFIHYIFPIMLDIAKVFCAFKVAQAFYEEKSGSSARDGGRTGFQSVVYYGKWYLAFWAIPLFVELIDEIGSSMYDKIIKQGISGLKQ